MCLADGEPPVGSCRNQVAGDRRSLSTPTSRLEFVAVRHFHPSFFVTLAASHTARSILTNTTLSNCGKARVKRRFRANRTPIQESPPEDRRSTVDALLAAALCPKLPSATAESLPRFPMVCRTD